MMSRYSRKSIEYFKTSTCAFTPRTFSRNCSRNPPVTLIAMVNAATPSVTPPTARAVLIEIMLRFFDLRYRSAIESGKPILDGDVYRVFNCSDTEDRARDARSGPRGTT